MALTLQMINMPQFSVVNLKLITVLALVEHIANSHCPSANLCSSVRKFWAFWANIANNDSHAHRALMRLTFFPLMAPTLDSSFVHSCVCLASAGFLQFNLSDDIAWWQAQLLVVKCLAVAAVSGNSLWERMVMEIPLHTTFPQWLSLLLSKTILCLIWPPLSRTIYIRDSGFYNGRVLRTSLSMLLGKGQFPGTGDITKLLCACTGDLLCSQARRVGSQPLE